MMDRFQLTFSVLSSRTASTEYWGAPKQNARCRGGKFGVRKQPVRRSFATSARLQSPPEPLRCWVRAHGVVARREPRFRSELFHAKGVKKRRGLLAGGPLIASHVCGQRHDDARFIANARESAAVFISEWLGRNHPCQVNWDWLMNKYGSIIEFNRIHHAGKSQHMSSSVAACWNRLWIQLTAHRPSSASTHNAILQRDRYKTKTAQRVVLTERIDCHAMNWNIWMRRKWYLNW